MAALTLLSLGIEKFSRLLGSAPEICSICEAASVEDLGIAMSSNQPGFGQPEIRTLDVLC